VALCGFAICGPKLFCELKTSASPQIDTFSPDVPVTVLQMYKVRKSLKKYTTLRLLGPFSDKVVLVLYKYADLPARL
jgi:hypothetical protein